MCVHLALGWLHVPGVLGTGGHAKEDGGGACICARVQSGESMALCGQGGMFLCAEG